jgi:pyridoxine 5-phosphate synthase
MNQKVRLGVNIDHVATLRQLRAGTVDYPDIVEARNQVVAAGADQITIHLRGDRRHIQEVDLNKLSQDKGGVPLNLEMAATGEMLKVALKTRPDIVCIVPEKREEVTTEGGLDALKYAKILETMTKDLHKAGVRVSLFVEPDLKQIKISREVGADAVEFHTGRYAIARGAGQASELQRLDHAFNEAHGLKLAVHAGHGLDYVNTVPLLKNQFLEELNIGHSIVCRAVFVGLAEAVREMKDLIKKAGRDS